MPRSLLRRMLLRFSLVVASFTAPGCDVSVDSVVRIPDAENALFTPNGRLFVTGGENAFEIVREGKALTARPLSPTPCNFTGLALRGDVLYATCVQGGVSNGEPLLMAGRVTQGAQLAEIHRFSSVSLPNGIAFTDAGRLLIADSDLLDSKLVELSFSPGDPFRVVQERTFDDRGFLMANGLKVLDGTAFVTDLISIKTVEIRPDGTAGRAHVLVRATGVFDDLSVSRSGILVADFLFGHIEAYTLDGRFRGATGPRFAGPSSVTPTVAGVVPAGSLLVTEKGILGDLSSRIGNRISLVELAGGEPR